MKRTYKRCRQAGLSLVETMIAMSLGAVVTVGVIQLFTANSEAYNLMQGQSRMQESARFALDFVGRAVQQAGFKGCWSENGAVYTSLPGNVPYEFDIGRGMRAYNHLGGGWSPDPTTDFNNPYVAGNEIDISQIVPGTDIFTLRYASQTMAQVAQNHTSEADPVPTDIPFADLENDSGTLVWPGQFREDELILFHDCEKASVIRLTGIDSYIVDAGNLADYPGVPSVGTYARLAHATGVGPTENLSGLMTDMGSFFEDDANVSAIRTATFFIAPGAGINNIGDTPLSLWRKFGTDAPVEIVEGVEDLQIQFGVDENGDGVPNNYREPNLVNDNDYWRVRTVRITITTNSVDDVGGTSTPTHGCIHNGGQQACIDGVEDFDGLIRRSFSQTIQIRNRG